MYQQIIDLMTGIASTLVILRTTDNAFIPIDPNNKDYQAYLTWAAAGNTITPPQGA